MKPLFLKLSGINSFIEETNIDFTKLLAGGIFGIFGPTGSGKSSILDSMILALYGKMKRSSVQGDFINNTCNEAKVDFSFSINDCGVPKIYRITRSYKRRKGGEVTGNGDLFIKEGNDYRAITSGTKSVNEEVEKIIGLDFDDFRKCIVLPQGEFDEFLKTQRTKRLEIVGRLFDLEKYGKKLSQNANLIKAGKKTQMDTTEGELNAYSEYTRESYLLKQAEYKETAEQLERLNAQLQLLKAQKERYEDLKNYTIEYNKNEQKYLNLQTQKNTIESKRNVVENYEKLGDTKTLIATNERLLAEIEQSLEKIEKYKQNKAYNASKLEENANRLSELNYENVFESIVNEIAQLTAIEDKVQERDKLKKERDKLRVEYQTLEKQLSTAQDDLKRQKNNLNVLLMDSGLNGVEGVISAVISGAKTLQKNQDIMIANDFIKSLPENLVATAKDTLCTGFVEGAESEEEILKNAKTQLTEIDSAKSKEKDALVEIINQLEVDIAKKTADSNNILATGKEVKEKIDALNSEISSKTFGEDYKTLIDKKNSQKDNLNKNKERYTLEIDRLNQEIADLDGKIKVENTKIDQKKQLFEENELNINKNLKKCGIIDTNGIDAYIISNNLYEDYKKQIKTFDEGMVTYVHEKERLQALLNGNFISQEEFDEKNASYVAFEKEVVDMTKKESKLQGELDIICKKLQEKSVKQTEYDAIKKDFDLISKLCDLVKSDALLEYVANEYLKEVCFNAQSRLLELSSGRYGLDYDNNEFKVIDNFASGEKRSISTLSGGETFLVSLSLALALSKAIFTKSNRPIEFFFLDEGFGTLDSGLVDAVADSLEKLKQDGFLIGLISHVKELKQRINCKIIVQSATETHGSKAETIID